jgi:poly-gamma-glutamate synthesis protein (capsule biosynthesis protein)
MLAVGDIIPGPNAEASFELVTPMLKEGDIVVGQLEVPHTDKDFKTLSLGSKPIATGNSTKNLFPLISANFTVLTLAGNHILDAGIAGIEDTIAWIKNHNIDCVGAGMNIDEARSPVVVEREGTRFGFLDYNCVGPKETWANVNKPGCAYIDIITHYEGTYACPGGPPIVYTWAETNSLQAMIADITKLRPLCDILIVTFHKGIGHTPARLAAYEHQVSYAAIDAGADIILGHHAHILKGIELYKGKPIFHGLCNFVTYAPILALGNSQDPDSWARKRIDLYGFEPDPEYPTYPFHPEAKYTIIAKCLIENKRLAQTSFIPCLINKQGQPEILKRDNRGQEVFNYMERITQKARLNAKFQWAGEEIVIST